MEITEKIQILRNSNRTQVHGRPAVIVYTSMCTSIVLLTEKKTSEHRNHKRIKTQVCMAETVLSRAINIGYGI